MLQTYYNSKEFSVIVQFSYPSEAFHEIGITAFVEGFDEFTQFRELATQRLNCGSLFLECGLQFVTGEGNHTSEYTILNNGS